MDNDTDAGGEVIGGKGSGRHSTTDKPRDKHTVTLTDELWDRIVLVAGGERKVSEELEKVLRDHYRLKQLSKT